MSARQDLRWSPGWCFSDRMRVPDGVVGLLALVVPGFLGGETPPSRWAATLLSSSGDPVRRWQLARTYPPCSTSSPPARAGYTRLPWFPKAGTMGEAPDRASVGEIFLLML